MLKAVLFDCDGVVADSERLHFALFRQLLKEKGLDLTWEDYAGKYLALDDRGVFEAVSRDLGQRWSLEEQRKLGEQKSHLYQEAALRHLIILPGVVEFVMAVSQKYPLAMASGALREEVRLMLKTAGIEPYFEALIAAEDVTRGKPSPEPYLKALEALRVNHPGIEPAECLVVEDSKGGLQSARAAGMKCVAVEGSYTAEELKEADRVVPVLTALRLKDLEKLFV